MHYQSISVDGVDTCYIEQGEGPTIVFMHGGSPGMDAWACWLRQFVGLAGEFRVIAFDQIGYGRTGGPLLPRVERTDHAVGFLKKLGIRDACLVGHSEGAFLITRAAILAPETTGRLVLVAPGSSAPILGGDADEEWLKPLIATTTMVIAIMTRKPLIATTTMLIAIMKTTSSR